MKIGIIGTGRLGSTLARRWGAAGHTILLGSRSPEKARELAATLPNATGVSYQEAAAGADVIFFAVPFSAAQGVLRDLGDLGGKILIECTNDLGSAPTEANSAQKIAGWAQNARVVKAFNTIFSAILASDKKDGLGTVFLAGDSADAKAIVKGLVTDAGFEPVDVGGLDKAHFLDSLVELIIHLGYGLGHGGGITYKIVQVI